MVDIPKVGPITGVSLIGGSGKGVPIHLKYDESAVPVDAQGILWDDGDQLLWDDGDNIDWDN